MLLGSCTLCTGIDGGLGRNTNGLERQSWRSATEPQPILAFTIMITYNVCMKDLRFQWDPEKGRDNERKHGVSFAEAQTVFLDENAIQYFDPDHSTDEDRFIMLGMSFQLRILVVCHCLRESDTVIRIFSARKALPREARAYWR
jgi:uncharacterized DUF497 family protein